MMKIRIFQPVIQEYRLALYSGLARRYGDAIELWASSHRGDEKSFPVEGMRSDYDHPWHQIGPIVWQSGFSLRGLSCGDVIVVCGDVHQLSSLLIALKAKCCRIRVVWWGHHKSALAKDLSVRIRLWIARRLTTVMLCYTDEGKKYLEEKGFDRGIVFATGNTLDVAAVERMTRTWDGRKKFGTKKTLLFCGVMREKVRVDVLLRALRHLRERRCDFHCVLIGSGEKLSSWKDLSEGVGVSDLVTWLGDLRGQEQLAPWFLSSDLFVYPGRIGLSIIHAFSYGLPVVLNDNRGNHGPEYVTFSPGENGWVFKENDDVDLCRVIDGALDSGECASRGTAGRKLVLENYSMDRMVAHFVEAIEAAGAKE